MKSEIGAVNAKVDGMKSEIKTEMEAVNAKVDGMKSEIGAVNAKVDGMKSDIGEIMTMLRRLSPTAHAADS